jgi:hypothetical protein
MPGPAELPICWRPCNWRRAGKENVKPLGLHKQLFLSSLNNHRMSLLEVDKLGFKDLKHKPRSNVQLDQINTSPESQHAKAVH